MNLKKVNWGLSLIVIVTVTTFIWTRTKAIKDHYFRYGKEFNAVRDSLNVPKIELDWITHDSSPTYRFWSNPKNRVTTVEPMHLYKATMFDKDKILTEEDDFHYETDDSLAFRVVYRYNFGDSTWDCRIIKYRKEKYSETESWKLTLGQADSVLNKWGLSR
jgi:hypothetical protein